MDKLAELLVEEQSQLNKKIEKNNTPFLFIDLIKAIDYYWYGKYEKKEEFEYFINFGFSYFLRQFYKTSTFNEPCLPLSPSTINSLSFCHYHLYQYGKCRVIERGMELAKNNDVILKDSFNNDFILELSAKDTLEYVENKSVDEYLRLIRNGVLKDQIKNQEKKRERILELLDKEVKVWRGHYIQYDSTPEIDEYYYREGYIHLVTTQLYDDFEEQFEFGGIPYKHFLDVVQSIIGVALKHIDACILLHKKNPKINLFDIISIPTVLEEIYPSFSNYLGIKIEHVKKIFDLLVVSAENIDVHLKDDKDFSPPFIKIGSRFVYRSIKGCLCAPILFLHNELKRQYPKDYFRWINEREVTFRNQLYHLFKSDRFIKIERNIELNSKGIRTDIDAVIFDKQTKNLGFFQLKWQDKFSSDLKARKSKISNFYPKAKEWIEKIIKWQESIDKKEILSSLNINDTDIQNIYLFVIGRYNTHFSNQEVDERAAWGSWYHMVELTHKIKTDFDDPIRELFFKLKFDSPRNKDISDEIKGDESNYKVELSNCTLTWSYA
ncbi:MAG: hypothetical protein LBI15_03130 [Dysgonamonadaceae bacterium]|nr:hypothetical protein [Dysgonamonadaceae bacterium]